MRISIRNAPTLAIGLVLMLVCSAAAFAQASNVVVTVDGQTVNFDQPPVVANGHVLVPLRGIFERLGANVEFHAASQSIRATRGTTTVQLTLGSARATVDDKVVALEVPAQTQGGRTLVPLRFVSEALGAQVTWNAGARLVAIASQSLPPSTTINPTPTTDATGAAPQITEVYQIAAQTLRPGDTVTAEADGTPGSVATFDLLGVSNGNSMKEAFAGHYVGTVTISSQMPRGGTAVVVHLARNGLTIARQSTSTLMISSAGGQDDSGTHPAGYLRNVNVSAQGPVRPGQVVTVRVRGTAGANATLDAGSGEVPLTEIRPGLYAIDYIVRRSDDLDRRPEVTLRLPDGSAVRRRASVALGQAYANNSPGPGSPPVTAGPIFVTVDSPRSGDRIGREFTVSGMTRPYATVDITAMARRAVIPGVLGVNGETVHAQAQADVSGRYAISIRLRSTPNRSDVQLEVTARDQEGHSSPTVEFDIATGE